VDIHNRDEDAYNDDDIENLLEDSIADENEGAPTIPDDSYNNYDDDYVAEFINGDCKPHEVFQLASKTKKSSIQTYNTTLDDSPSNEVTEPTR